MSNNWETQTLYNHWSENIEDLIGEGEIKGHEDLKEYIENYYWDAWGVEKDLLLQELYENFFDNVDWIKLWNRFQ